MTPEQIVEDLSRISTVDVYAALVYYDDHRAEVDADLDEDLRIYQDGLREQAERLARLP